MKLFDCFMFFNEFEILELRLKVLHDIVDYFVLVEANKTQIGTPKQCFFEANKDRFSDYMDKIIYIKVEDLPEYSSKDIWLVENFQRNCITRGLRNASSKDKIIVSDVDEIPNPKIMEKYLGETSLVTMTQHLFYYYVNCLQNQKWTGSILTTQGTYDSIQTLRHIALSGKNAVPDGGWHYSFMGGAERIKLKVESITDSQPFVNKIGTTIDIENKIKQQKDIFGRTNHDSQKHIIDISKNGMAPECIDWFIEKYPNFFFNK